MTQQPAGEQEVSKAKFVRRKRRHNNQLANKRQMGGDVSVDKRRWSVDKTRGGGDAMRGVATISRRQRVESRQGLP